MEKKKGSTGKKAAVTGVAAVALLAALLGFNGLGLGGGSGAPAGANDKQDAAVETRVQAESPETTVAAAEESAAASIEIRVQGREYNYQNVSYGSKEHPLEELLTALAELPRDTKIELIVEENATKNAVDELERALTEAGFGNILK